MRGCVEHGVYLLPIIRCFYLFIYFGGGFVAPLTGVWMCVCVCLVWCLDFVFGTFLFRLDFTVFGISVCVYGRGVCVFGNRVCVCVWNCY